MDLYHGSNTEVAQPRIMRAYKLVDQWVFCTDRALQHLRFMKSHRLE